MKKLLLLALCSIIFATSCTHTIYNTKVLQSNYQLRMDSGEELEIKSKVRIFLSEKDVQGDYEVISLNTYKPFTIPILMSVKSQTNKKFFEKAVKKAHELGGNGIIVMAGGLYKVINLRNWNSDIAASETFANPILDVTLMNKFKNGEIAKMLPREVKKSVKNFKDEVEFNLKNMKTSQESKVVKEKILALQAWNNSQAKPNSGLMNKIKAYTKLHTVLAKKIAKKEAKSGVKKEVKKAPKTKAKNKK